MEVGNKWNEEKEGGKKEKSERERERENKRVS